ncbi:uncharacterized protein [Procambarus clarkii]|uniref:uncharacterized protein n=1 Tax=Procambarus clarkii TaxID=6728 RepID=UPI001E676EBB|nr:uncharacterized protein LOC123756439 [Procambarus clarkii]XP_045595561.1 uncharacterized protein LOC123756439 [Procambarus clarkii]XP_045595562.1 uncharacterized protein LOC123756439 [Procambarus clarkii]
MSSFSKARMRIPVSLKVDSEGFPKPAASKGDITRQDQRDEENGEILKERVITLRRGHRAAALHSLCSRTNVTQPYHLLEDHKRIGCFRIQDFTDNNGKWKLRCGDMKYLRPPDGFKSRSFQTCLKLEGGVPVSYTTTRKTFLGPSMDILSTENCRRNQIFRVPVESLPQNQTEKPLRDPEAFCVNIWEEFLFGKSILGDNKEEDVDEDSGPLGKLHVFLRRYMSTSCINILTYAIYFVIYFASCCSYNMFWQLGTYILLASHLQIHERAYDKKIKLEFTGSSFQGPAYVFVRSWCQHCIQRDTQKVMMSLMKKMKADINASAYR